MRAAESLAETETLTHDVHRDVTARFLTLTTNRLGDAADELKHVRLDGANYVADVMRLAELVAGGLPSRRA